MSKAAASKRSRPQIIHIVTTLKEAVSIGKYAHGIVFAADALILMSTGVVSLFPIGAIENLTNPWWQHTGKCLIQELSDTLRWHSVSEGILWACKAYVTLVHCNQPLATHPWLRTRGAADNTDRVAKQVHRMWSLVLVTEWQFQDRVDANQHWFSKRSLSQLIELATKTGEKHR